MEWISHGWPLFEHVVRRGQTTYKVTFYTEAGSTGPGATMGRRVSREKKLSPAQIRSFEPRNFLRGSDGWNPVAAAARLP